MEGFRFHITLTGKRPRIRVAKLQRLAAHLAPILPRPFAIDALSLMAEDADGPLPPLHRHALAG